MPRPYRIQYPNAIYHVMNRGQNCQTIFKDKSDFEDFLKLLQKSHDRWDLQVFAFC